MEFQKFVDKLTPKNLKDLDLIYIKFKHDFSTLKWLKITNIDNTYTVFVHDGLLPLTIKDFKTIKAVKNYILKIYENSQQRQYKPIKIGEIQKIQKHNLIDVLKEA